MGGGGWGEKGHVEGSEFLTKSLRDPCKFPCNDISQLCSWDSHVSPKDSTEMFMLF